MKTINYTNLVINGIEFPNLLYKGGFTEDAFNAIKEAYDNDARVDVRFRVVNNNVAGKTEGEIRFNTMTFLSNGGIKKTAEKFGCDMFKAIKAYSTVLTLSRMSNNEILNDFCDRLKFYVKD